MEQGHCLYLSPLLGRLFDEHTVRLAVRLAVGGVKSILLDLLANGHLVAAMSEAILVQPGACITVNSLHVGIIELSGPSTKDRIAWELGPAVDFSCSHITKVFLNQDQHNTTAVSFTARTKANLVALQFNSVVGKKENKP